MFLENKVVVITGGGSGIGQACALAFAEAGAAVFVTDIDSDGGAETIQAIEANDGRARYLTADVTQPDEVKTMIQAAKAHFGGIDVIINNAGITGDTSLVPLHEIEDDTYTRTMDVNVRGVWLCMKYAIPALIERGGGSIVNIASVAGLIGFPGGSVYSASKHAVIGLTKSAALELARYDIRVNALCPSYTDTPMVAAMADESPRISERMRKASPMRRLGTAEEMAQAAVWLASDRATFTTGIAFPVDGGLTAM
jgi:NAD(P)-dependent dehydrogenase (short-subunit alcohol dehydrogenase family)